MNKFPLKKTIGDVEIILDYDESQNDFSWESGSLGGVGFASLNEAENDALFWTLYGQDYLYTEQMSKGS